MATSTFTIGGTEGEPTIQIIVSEQPDGTLKFDVEVVEGTAELNGLFFDMLGDVNSDYGTLTMVGEEGSEIASTYEIDEGDVSNLGGGVNVNGEVVKEYGQFDAGVVTGDTGLGDGDTQSYTFYLDSDTTDLTLADILGQDFAIRLTSVGDDGSREGSLKLAGTAPEGPDLEGPDPEGEDPTSDDPGDLGGLDPEGPTGDTGGDTGVTDPLLDEIFVFSKDETGGDSDGGVLANDEPGQTIVSVTNSAGETFDVVEGGTVVPGTEGGLLTIFPDGTVDFDAGTDFEALYEGDDPADVTFTYTSDTGASGNLTVTVEGSGAPGGDDDPILPPLEDEAIDPLPPEDPDLLVDDFILG